MKFIELTQNQRATVDDEDFEKLNKHKWCAIWSDKTNSFYAVRKYKNKKILMHREIINTPKGMICDHINHDTLNNRKENLRNVTSSQSNMNRKPQSDNLIGEHNINLYKGSYRVRIHKNKQLLYNKRFSSLESAIKFRDLFLTTIHEKFKYK